MLHRAWTAALLLLPAAPLPRPAPLPTTIFIVRHAEKATDDPRDPSLTEAGRRRAVELARVLQDARITALFATEFKRTRETLAPLAEALGTQPVLLAAADLTGLVQGLEALPPGSRAIVASHSNLIHQIVARLTGTELVQLTEADYDRLFVVTVTATGIGSVVVLRFGER